MSKAEDKNPFSVIILAAGKGTRMNSPLPKVLHPVAGEPMVARVVRAAKEAGAAEVRVVVGFGGELVKSVVEPLGAVCFHQKQQWGTGDAVRSAQPESLKGLVVVLNGDHPLIEAQDLSNFVKEYYDSSASLAVVTSEIKKPGQYGRIVRQSGQVHAIVEAKDAGHEVLKINEINTGLYLIPSELLSQLLPEIQSHNAQNEFYLTDVVSLAIEQDLKVEGLKSDPRVAFGVNDQWALAQATKRILLRKAKRLMEQGVIIIDPYNVHIEDRVEVGSGSVIYSGVSLLGATKVGQYCVFEPNCFVNACEIEDSVQIKAGSYLEQSKIGQGSQVGPYAHLRPDSQLGKEVKVGNFVELKKVHMKDRSKASHLTYLGDAEIGEDSNIGCGTITCNYAVDKKKYFTKIGKGVFVGSDTQFVAPIEVGDHAVIASGSTITKDVPAGALAVARGRQIVKENYSPLKNKKKE